MVLPPRAVLQRLNPNDDNIQEAATTSTTNGLLPPPPEMGFLFQPVPDDEDDENNNTIFTHPTKTVIQHNKRETYYLGSYKLVYGDDHPIDEAKLQALQQYHEEQMNPEWQQPQSLHRAVETGNYNRVSQLLRKGRIQVVVNERDSLGRSPLDIAFLHGSKRMFNLLIQEGGSSSIIVSPDNIGIAACLDGGIGHGILCELVQSTSARDIINSPARDPRFRGCTPLQAVIRKSLQEGQLHLYHNNITTLLNIGANPNLPDPDGSPSLHRILLSMKNTNSNNNNNNNNDHTLNNNIILPFNNILLSFLGSGADPNTLDSQGNTALQLALTTNVNDVIVDILLSAGGGNPNAFQLNQDGGTTGVHAVIQNGYSFRTVSSIVRGGVGGGDNGGRDVINLTDSQGRTVLHIVMGVHHRDIVLVTLLLHVGANCNIQDSNGWSPLHHHAWFGENDNSDRVRRDIMMGRVPADAANIQWRGDGTILSSLIIAGSNVNLHDNEGRSALLFAAQRGHVGIVLGLLGAGADPNGEEDTRPLTVADLQVGQFVVLMNNHDHNQASGPIAVVTNFSVLRPRTHVGLRVCPDPYGHYKGMEFWYPQEVAISTLKRCTRWGTPLHKAVEGRHLAVTDALLQARPGADPNRRNEQGMTPLHLAAAMLEGGSTQFLNSLIQHGGNILAGQHGTGMTPLHFAAKSGNLATVKVLLAEAANTGANITNIPSSDGKTSLHCACERLGGDHGGDFMTMVRALLREGGDLGRQDNFGMVPVLYAASVDADLGLLFELILKGAETGAILHH